MFFAALLAVGLRSGVISEKLKTFTCVGAPGPGAVTMLLRPEERYESARALAADVERWLAGQPVRALPESFLERAKRSVRRQPLLAVAALSAALLVTSAASVTALFVASTACSAACFASAPAWLPLASASRDSALIFAVFSDALHLLAAAVWTAGVLVLATGTVTSPAAIRRFTAVATACVVTSSSKVPDERHSPGRATDAQPSGRSCANTS